LLQKETKASTVNCSLGELEPNKRKISRFRKFQKLIQNLFKDGLVTHRFGQIQSDSWDNGLFNYSLFGLKSRLVMLDFRAIFGKIGLARNFLSGGHRESLLLAVAKRSMQYCLIEPWLICAAKSSGAVGFR